MQINKTEKEIRKTAKRLFARNGYDGVSMRILSKESSVGLSSIYHFFKDKDVLLKSIYEDTNRNLGLMRANLPDTETAEDMLCQLIRFQFDHIEDIVYVLKYYLHYRSDFAKLPTRTLPPKSVLHIEEVIKKGLATGEFDITKADIPSKARVVSHTINGYLLEYYPDIPDAEELEAICGDIVKFAVSGFTK